MPALYDSNPTSSCQPGPIIPPTMATCILVHTTSLTTLIVAEWDLALAYGKNIPSLGTITSNAEEPILKGWEVKSSKALSISLGVMINGATESLSYYFLGQRVYYLNVYTWQLGHPLSLPPLLNAQSCVQLCTWTLICRGGPPLNVVIWVSLLPGHSQWPGKIMCPLCLPVEEKNALVDVLDQRTYPFQYSYNHKPLHLLLFVCFVLWGCSGTHTLQSAPGMVFSKLLRTSVPANLPIMQDLCQSINSYVL